MMNGGTLFKLQRILGHKGIQMTERYSHLAPTAFVEDYGRLGGAADVLGPENVIRLAESVRDFPPPNPEFQDSTEN